MQRLVEVDNKVRTDKTYPVGFMDVVTIPKTDEHFRLVYDAKGRFVVHRISKEEAAYKLCKVRRVQFGKGGIPYIATHDGRTIRYPDPDIKVRGVGTRGRGEDVALGLSGCVVVGTAGQRAVFRQRQLDVQSTVPVPFPGALNVACQLEGAALVVQSRNAVVNWAAKYVLEALALSTLLLSAVLHGLFGMLAAFGQDWAAVEARNGATGLYWPGWLVSKQELLGVCPGAVR
jgi:hypothetical protein